MVASVKQLLPSACPRSCPPGAAVAKCAAYACDPAYIQYPDCDAASAPGASCEIAPCIAGFLDNGYQARVAFRN